MAKRKYKRLHYEDRQTIEAMSKQGSSVSAHSNRAAGRAVADTASGSRRTNRRAGRERGCK